jgi:hypothetical protein
MPEKNDTKDIIKQFLELWQKQFSYITKDPQNIAAMFKTFQQTQESYFNSTKRQSDVKPSSATDLSDNAYDELCKLERRIADLEARLAKLESGPAGTGKKPARTNTRAKSPGAGARTAKSVRK